MKSFKILIGLFVFAFTVISAQTSWTIDKPHTSVGFSVTHLVITEVEGGFLDFDGKIETKSNDFEDASVMFEIKVASIDTDISARDKHLKSPDFFDAEKYPNITFKSKSFKKADGRNYKMTGDLTIKDVTKEIVMDVVHRGTVTGPGGKQRAGFKLAGEIDRFDFNLKWNKAVEAGPIVDKTIKLMMNVQLIKN